MPEPRSGARAHARPGPGGGGEVQGVGGRQGDLFAPEGGGGYLDECNPVELPQGTVEDTKFRELEEMGLPAVWLEGARLIGYENFVRLWRHLDGAAAGGSLPLSDNESMIEVRLRRFASFQRFQRNRFIESLAALGLDGAEIQVAVHSQLGEKLTRNHILRLIRRSRDLITTR